MSYSWTTLVGGQTAVAIEAYDVFLSYSRADWRHAADIDFAFRARDFKPFFDRRNLQPGLPWVRELEEAIATCGAVVVLIGPRGFGDTQQREMDLAFFRQTRDRAFPVVPVFLPEANVDAPLNFLQVNTWIDFSHVAKVSDASDELERLLTALQGKRTLADTARESICPYRGLDAFREEDSALFFGRGAEDDPESPIGQLVSKVREYPFVIVVGRSGSGKSSLVYAGLLPALRRERDRFWNVLTLRPGPSPLRALAAAFNPRRENEGAAEYAGNIGAEADRLKTGDIDLLSHMIRAELDGAEGKPGRLLLYVDQWEELYAQGASSRDGKQVAQHTADVTRFIDLLLAAARSGLATIVATVRADFYDPLISHRGIQALLPTQQVTIGRMSRCELESTIVEPAKKVGLRFNPPGLVQRILDDTGEDEGMLPLLQYALKEMWVQRIGNAMTGDSYARSGGVREAIRRTADRTFDALSPEDQGAARQIFILLVTPGEGQENTRLRANMPTQLRLRKVVDQFAGPRTRLLVTGSDSAQRPTVEVAHEALIRTWPRLREWVDANREKLRSRSAILQAQIEWERNGRRDDLLLPAGFQLERARALLADPGVIVIDELQDFITLSAKRAAQAWARTRLLLASIFALLVGVIAGLVGWINEADVKSQLEWLFVIRPYMDVQYKPYVLSPDAERKLKSLQSFMECASDCPEMVVVAAGTFKMGSIGYTTVEEPQQEVTISKFAVSKFAVTFAEWDACAQHGGCGRYLPSDHLWGRGQQPVIFVSWVAAASYVEWLRQMTGRHYRLLSEAEYEYATRAGTETVYPWGDDIGEGHANCKDCGSPPWGYQRTAPVGLFPPNRFGLYDMVGNVRAWVEDCAESVYPVPKDGTPWTAGKCNSHLTRGGSWYDDHDHLRSARRDGKGKDYQDNECRHPSRTNTFAINIVQLDRCQKAEFYRAAYGATSERTCDWLFYIETSAGGSAGGVRRTHWPTSSVATIRRARTLLGV
jgi:formylglycine-generating enzyme required for sulfatase activity